jgi:hypothetical protein
MNISVKESVSVTNYRPSAIFSKYAERTGG